MKKVLETHTLRGLCRDFALKRWGLNEIVIWVEKGSKRVSAREMSKCLKNCHICYIKLKTCIFCGLGSSDAVTR